MDSELVLVNKAVKNFDRELFAKRDGAGVIRVYHDKREYDVYKYEGANLFVPVSRPYHVFSLTDTWGYWGKPVSYGLLPLREKLLQVSMENRDRLFQELTDAEKASEETRKKDISNITENYAREAREVFKDATKDVVFSNIDKKNDKRRIFDKKIKQEI